MIKPRALRPGDRIAIVSPASPFARDEFERGAAEIARLGFTPVYDATVFARDRYTSGDAATRAAAFLAAWRDPDVAALIAVRGGYGSAHLLPLLPREQLRRTPKLFIGYSDVTSIHSWLTCGCGIASLHGPMLDQRLAAGAEGYDEGSFVAALAGTTYDIAPPSLGVIRGGGAVSGPLFGGTLTQLASSLGTPYAFDPPDGCVLFLEDVNERPYRLDRLLTQMRYAGLLQRARAVVFGEMRNCDEPGGAPGARDTIARVLEDFRGPILYGLPSGHTTGPCWSVPLGVRVRVHAEPVPALVVEEPLTE